MTDKTHELYKELSAAINDLSKDMVKGLVSLRAVTSDNKSDIERLEQRMDRFVEDLRTKVEDLRRKEGVVEERLRQLDASIKKAEEARAKRKEQQGAMRVEDTKGRWAFWVAVVGGAAGVLTAVANLLGHLAGG